PRSPPIPTPFPYTTLFRSDFRPSWILGVYGLQGVLPEVGLRGEYTDDGALGDGKVQIVVKKFGREFGLAWETLINDDLGAFSDIDRKSTRLNSSHLGISYA